MTSQQQWLITGTVDGIPIGIFDSHSGGGADADVQKHRGGGMGEEKAYAAMPAFGDVTITRVCERERDVELHRRLFPRAGRALASLSFQPLDDNGSPWGTPFTRSGRFKSISDPESDSNSASPATFELGFVITSAA